MIPKEEAQKIHDKYYFEIWNNVSFDDESEVYESAKQCALICVDEILKVLTVLEFVNLQYYLNVKKEINKL